MIYNFDELRSHIGHSIVCVRYGQGDECLNVALECETCGTVLVDLDPGDLLSKELADEVGKTIAHVWSVDDVFSRAKERHINLHEGQCLEILHLIDKGKDADVGINWIVIDTVIDDYLDEVSKG